jgi:ATP-binding cassette subfamily F protein 3
MLIRFTNVSRAFGAFDVLRDVTFQIDPRQKVGLVGANGSGKTTLLGLVEQPDECDRGEISRAADLHVGRLEQIPALGDRSVYEIAVDAFADLIRIEEQLQSLEGAISDQPDEARLLERYAAAQHEFEFRGGYGYRARTEGALFGLGFENEDFERRADTLSGGEKNRLALARLLLSDVNLLLLDEPTNHLDIRAIEWLEHFLRETERAVLVVSHDRFFLDRVATRIVELERGRATEYAGNYTAFLKQKEERRATLEKEWQRQQEWIQKTEDFVRKNIAGQKTKQAQARRNALQRLERIERPPSIDETARFRFRAGPRTGRIVLRTRALDAGYPGKALIRELDLEVERGERWALVGPNGSGKTTLLRTLTRHLDALGGEIHWDDRVEIGYYDQQLADLAGPTVLDEIRAVDTNAGDGDLRAFLAQFQFRGDDVFKPVDRLSGGEKSRLVLARIIWETPQLLALDEPTNHLDILARDALERALCEYPGTILFVTHDRRLVEKIASHILYIDIEGLRRFDRFDAFETWLGESVDAGRPPSRPATPPEPDTPKREPVRTRPTLSKNMRERIEQEMNSIESRIGSHELEVREIERQFQESPLDLDWDRANQRYAKLKQRIEELYEKLEEQIEKLG